MRRAALLAFLALAPAAHAAGSGPLLSGYGGPGDGEQALLGTTIIRDTPRTGGSPAAPAPAPAPEAIFENAPAPVPAAVPEEAPAGRKPARDKPARDRPEREPAATAPVGRPEDSTTVAVGTGGDPVSAPAPVEGRDLALLAAVLLALLVLAACARRLAVRAARERRPVPLQVP